MTIDQRIRFTTEVDSAALERFVRGVEDLDDTSLRNLEREATRIEDRFANLGRSISGLGRTLSVSLTAPLTAIGALSVRAFGQQAEAIANVEAGLRSTGNAAGLTSERLQEVASALQNNTTFGDEEILGGLTSTLLTFTNVTGDEFLRAQEAVLDLSATLGQDLQSAALQVGRALNDPVAGLSALSRAGIQFTDSQREVIESLVESGDAAGAQAIILEELERQFGGTAAAIAQAGTGPLSQLTNTIGDLSEEFGRTILQVVNPAITQLNTFIQNLIVRIQGLSPEIRRAGVIAAGFAAALGPVLLTVGSLTTLLAPLIGRIGSVINALGGLQVVLPAITRSLATFFSRFLVIGTIVTSLIQLETRFGVISQTIRTLFGVIVDLANAFGSLFGISIDLGNIINDLGSVFEGVSRFIGTVFSVVINSAIGSLSLLGSTALRTVNALSRLPGIRRILPAGFNDNIDSAISRLDDLRQAAADNARASINNFVAGGIATPGTAPTTQTQIQTPDLTNVPPVQIPAALDTQINIPELQTEIASETEGSISIPATIEANVDQQTLDGFQRAFEIITSDVEQQTLRANRTLTGTALQDSLSDIQTVGAANLNAIRDNLIGVINTISDPELLAAGERLIAQIGEQAETAMMQQVQRVADNQQFLQQAGQTLSSSFDTFFDSVTTGSQNAEQAFEDFATSIVRELASQALRSALTAAFSGGGQVGTAPLPGFNTGGLIRGRGTGTSDSILARVSNGEFVQRAAAVRSFGSDFMNAVNNLNPSRALELLSDRFGTQGFAMGGFVDSLGTFTNRITNIDLPRFETGGPVTGQTQMMMPNVNVNVVNNGSNQQTARTEQSFNGSSVVVDVILEDIRTNGRIARGMSNAFGLGRSAV